VIIEDADTNWTIDHIHHDMTKDGTVFLFGEYSEMTST
jgi:hypothetical protein